MAIFNFKKEEPIIQVQQTQVTEGNHYSFAAKEGKDHFEFAPNLNPLVKVFGVYINGERNLFPNYLNYVKHQSPLHATILNVKALLTVANGYTYDDKGLDVGTKISLNQLLFQFDEVLDSMGRDYWDSSNIYLKVLWNKDHTKILRIKHIPHEKIRIKDVDQEYEALTYEYCYDWANVARFSRVEYPKFNQRDTSSNEQIFHFQLRSEGQVIYNRPKFIAGLDWAIQNGMMGEYHTANMMNSVNPSALIEFFKKIDPDGQRKVMADVNASYAGLRKTGRLMFLFNSDKDTAAKFTQMEPNKLDKTFIVLADTIQREICYAHGIDPQILGLKTPGALGNSLSLPEAFRLFNYNQISPAQKDIECILNKFLAINQVPVKIKLNNANYLFEDQTAQASAVSDSGAIKDDNMKITEETASPAANSAEDIAKANLRGSVGGVQGILAIQAAVSAGTSDYNAAVVVLMEIYGFSEITAKAILGTPIDKTNTNSKPIA